MILGGMDVSGDPESGNYQYMAIVLCTLEGEKILLKQTGTDQIHMSQIQDADEQNRIISALKFDGRQCIALCIRTNRDHIITKVQSRRATRKKPRFILIRTYNYILWSHIRDIIVKFLATHKADLHDVCFQCDSDCVYFAKDSGLRHTAPGTVHGYADGVVWANNRGKEPDGVIVIDLTQVLEEEMLSKSAK